MSLKFDNFFKLPKNVYTVKIRQEYTNDVIIVKFHNK